jgi:site-specific DNA-methyltransferase (adenine-specific)
MIDYDPMQDGRESYEVAIAEIRRQKIASGEIVPWVRREVIGDATLYLGDALEITASVGPVDAVVTDPPYCSGAATEAGRGAATHQGLRSETIRSGRFQWFNADNMTTAGLCELLRSMCVRAPVVETGSIMAFCDWRMVTMLAPAMESAGWRLRNLVVWDKGHFGTGTGFRPRHEMIIHLTRRAPAFYSASLGNVLTHKRVGGDREHPTEKPVSLIEDLLRVVTPDDGVVLDPFMGGGSTGVACVQMGRKFVGVEVDPVHFDTACRRIAEAQRTPRLIAEPPSQRADLFGSAAE